MAVTISLKRVSRIYQNPLVIIKSTPCPKMGNQQRFKNNLCICAQWKKRKIRANIFEPNISISNWHFAIITKSVDLTSFLDTKELLRTNELAKRNYRQSYLMLAGVKSYKKITEAKIMKNCFFLLESFLKIAGLKN